MKRGKCLESKGSGGMSEKKLKGGKHLYDIPGATVKGQGQGNEGEGKKSY